MKSETVKPIPPRAATPQTCEDRTPLGKSAPAEALCEHDTGPDPDHLADHETDCDAPENRTGCGVGEDRAGDHDAGVG